jgi:hypothetical protein
VGNGRRVGSLARVGEVLGRKWEEEGFDKAPMVVVLFLVLKKNERPFLGVAEHLWHCQAVIGLPGYSVAPGVLSGEPSSPSATWSL